MSPTNQPASAAFLIAVHRVPWSTITGRTRGWHEYQVWAGEQPLGPRGGHCGQAVSACRLGVNRRFRTSHQALDAARELAQRTGGRIVWPCL